MKKLKLNLDMLAVEAFVTSVQEDEKGTVNGHLRDEPSETTLYSYNNEATCNDHTCRGWTCADCTIGIGCDEVDV
jgi:hypothetical protein